MRRYESIKVAAIYAIGLMTGGASGGAVLLPSRAKGALLAWLVFCLVWAAVCGVLAACNVWTARRASGDQLVAQPWVINLAIGWVSACIALAIGSIWENLSGLAMGLVFPLLVSMFAGLVLLKRR